MDGNAFRSSRCDSVRRNARRTSAPLGRARWTRGRRGLGSVTWSLLASGRSGCGTWRVHERGYHGPIARPLKSPAVPPGSSLGEGENWFRSRTVGEDLRNLTMPHLALGRALVEDTSFENTDLSQSLLNWSDFVRVSFAAADLHDSDLRCSNFDRCDCPPRTCRPRREPPRAAPAWDLTRARPPSHRSAPCLLAWRSPCIAIAEPPVGDALD